eukprot:4062227-Pyramimonas_sp.AAC.1
MVPPYVSPAFVNWLPGKTTKRHVSLRVPCRGPRDRRVGHRTRSRADEGDELLGICLACKRCSDVDVNGFNDHHGDALTSCPSAESHASCLTPSTPGMASRWTARS